MNDLASVALVGTARREGAAQIDPHHPAEALLAGLTGNDREDVFLLRAGVRAVCELAGFQAAEVPPLAPAPPEVRPVAPNSLVPLLREAISGWPEDVLVEFLGALDTAGYVLPPVLLPAILDIADPQVRKSLLPVVGQRGRWLAQLNPDWRWVLSAAETLGDAYRQHLERIWEEGTIADRCEALAALRRSDPAEARRWLQESLAREKPEHRARLVAALAAGLDPADEPFLEACLDDRSEQVRQTAAGLLARLPGSALARRMKQRAENLLVAPPRGGRSRFRVKCQPPQGIEAEGFRDGLPRKPPPGQGKQAAWIEAILAAVPPGWWCQKFAAAPAGLIQAIRDDPFADALLVGWTRAAIALAAEDPESWPWLGALWDFWLAALKRSPKRQKLAQIHGYLDGLLAAMPASLAEETLAHLVRERFLDDDVPVELLLAAVPVPWGESLALAYLEAGEALAGARRFDTLRLAARALPPALLGRAAELARFAPGGLSLKFHLPDAEAWHEFAAVVSLRMRFYEELQRVGGAAAVACPPTPR